MKKTFLTTLVFIMIVLTSIALVSCNLDIDFIKDKFDNTSNGQTTGDNAVHTHTFSEEKVADKYLKSEATCTSPALYYFSCLCGEKGTQTFVSGTALSHSFERRGCDNPMYCSVCNERSVFFADHLWQTNEEGTEAVCTDCGEVMDLSDCTHVWLSASCENPKTCSLCYKTEGESLGHSYSDATCLTPKTCIRCAVTDGVPLGHNYSDATCLSPKTCQRCGQTEGDLGEHNIVDGVCSLCGYTVPPVYATYTVRVQSAGQLPLSGVTVYVHNSDGYSLCTVPAVTDENGVVTFELEVSDNYSVELGDVPDGYEVKGGETREERYALLSEETVIALTSAPIKTDGFKTSYQLGDVMYDFTLTDVNGNSYTLSEVLKNKDMVMLNFWFINCVYCQMEFPHINTAYNKYKDDIEIFALNDFDSAVNIKAFPAYLGSPLDMPLIEYASGSGGLDLSKFPSRGYPTTVIIDRYGVVTMIQVGAITSEEKWNDLFEYFTKENYKQKIIRKFDDIYSQ